jgi:RNA polymerase sigma-70 factor (ECF subfamily)
MNLVKFLEKSDWQRGSDVVLTRTVEVETDLVEQARQGDRHAFGELVCRYYPGVIQVVYRLCGDAGLAQDMTQEAFLRAWINFPSFRPQSCLRNWLYRIAVNATLDVLRRRSEVTLEDEAVQMIADQADDPEIVLIKKERVTLLQKAMQSLPEAARAVLVLREYGELSYQEIANVLDVPVGTVMSRLNYARNRLREILKMHHVLLENEYA